MGTGELSGGQHTERCWAWAVGEEGEGTSLTEKRPLCWGQVEEARGGVGPSVVPCPSGAELAVGDGGKLGLGPGWSPVLGG